MEKSKNVPKVRFKGFTDGWERKLLDKLADFSKGSGYSKNDLCEVGSPIILYGRLYTHYQTAISGVDTFVIENKGSVVSIGNEVIVPASGETAEDIARASAVIQSAVILGGDLNIIYPYEGLNPIFLALSISNGSIWKELSKKAQGKSVVHLRIGDLREVELKYPKPDEQKQIGNYFQNIDKLIEAKQSRINKLKNIKKACLEKMFPKNGATVPEIRFKGFSGEWEHKYLKDTGIWDKGYGLPKSDLDDNGVKPCIHYGELFAYSEIIQDIKSYTNINSDKISSCNDLLFPDSDVTPDGLGRCSALDIPNVILGGGINILRLDKKFKSSYMSLNVNNNREQIIKRVTGTTVRHIHSKDLNDIELFVSTDVFEQQQIGTFFKKLDNLISQSEQQLTKLKNIKKACLEKMFVNKEDTL